MGLIITGGTYRGRKLSTDPASTHIRPTSGKVREALFSSLGERIEDARFADLYAGTGAVGLEALSRGAAEVWLVENHAKSWPLLKGNCEALTKGKADADRVHPVRASAAAFASRMLAEGRAFDLVFVDPPFQDDFSPLPELIGSLLAPGGMAVIQYPSRNPPSWIGSAEKKKIYGESGLGFFAPDEAASGRRSIF